MDRAIIKTGPKRRRRTRRELPEGQFSQWPRGYARNERRITLARIARAELTIPGRLPEWQAFSTTEDLLS